MVAVVAGVAISSTALQWAGVPVALAGLLWIAVAPRVPRWRPSEDPAKLRLGWLHEDFIAALREHQPAA